MEDVWITYVSLKVYGFTSKFLTHFFEGTAFMTSCLLPRPLTKQPFHNGDYPKRNELAPKEANSFLQELASF